MFLNDINFPNEIIEALINDNLVVFAGAGASMDSPTCLPNFEDLAKKIAEGTGEKLEDNDACEVFLGYLKSKGIDVNQHAAALLSDSCVKPNKMHEAIVDLFIDQSKVKIVTTNYDQMFEKVLEKRGISVPIYNAPALPLGNDINGIVHVHGNINDPDYMVVTDEDFGSAYLTEGYTTRFLMKLFDEYIVLFVGYSYNDIILRYLTRAMSRNAVNNRFIITDNEQAKWGVLGLVPILFPEKEFHKMREGIVKLGQRAKRGLLDWRNQFKEFREEPPRDRSLETEIDYCLQTVERSRVLAESIHGRDWLYALNAKGVFDNLFSPQTILSEFDLVWMNWVVAGFVGNDDEVFRTLYLNKGSKINPQFAAFILRKLWREGLNIPDETYKEYITVLENYIDSSWEIFQIIQDSSERGMYSICYRLFKKYYEISFVLEKQLLSAQNATKFKHVFKGETYHIKKSWECCKEAFLTDFPEWLLNFSKGKICEVSDKYRILEKGDRQTEPWDMVMLVIEEREGYHKENLLYLLCRIFCESFKICEQKYPVWSREFLVQCLQEPFVLLRKVALKALREAESISSCDKFDIFINNCSISSLGGKEQIFLLVAKIFNDLTDDRKNRLIDEIKAIDISNSEYPQYNWCVWIKRFCDSNNRINKLERDILSRNDFMPRDHPELDIEIGFAEWSEDKSPVTKEEMLCLEQEKLVELLNNYNEDPFEGPSRWGMLGTFSDCVKDNYKWALKVVKIFAEGIIEKEDAWQRLVHGVQDSNYNVKELISLFDIMVDQIKEVKDILGLSELLREIVKRDEIKEQFALYEKVLCCAADTIWNYRGKNQNQFDELITTVINSVLGNVLLSRVYMLLYRRDSHGIPKDYKLFFEKNLELTGEEKDIVLCVLGGHFNALYSMDKTWCSKRFSVILEGADQRSFMATWEGIAFFSRYLNKDVADALAPIYLKAVVHMNWLCGEARRGFIDLYVLLLIYVVENPCLEYIPKFYNVADEDDQRKFIEKIGYRLRDMTSAQKKILWNSWLKQYLINRYENKPMALAEHEKELFVGWLPYMEDMFAETVEIICRRKMPVQLDGLFLYNLEESKLVVKYPHEMILLLTKVLNDDTEFDDYGDYLSNIYNNAKGLTQKEKEAFEEALLKRNMNI